ncbi:hypothetical protein KDJ21_003445 [Metabacillus litoralis]|uniref:hypothetical protein n=1 Tax=Metabacillus litoralis TaxID=152268 RepID=UPI001E51A289|nr:hypothetical protein [Metabacillus litoralis]UHA60787.1 hypothetical protein KDJ21_003445 [Metabacillus litoralis]
MENSDLLKLALSETIRSALKDESRNINLFKETMTILIEEAKTNKTINTRFDSKMIASVLVGIYFNTLISWSVSQDESVNIVSIFEGQYEVIWEGIEQDLN